MTSNDASFGAGVVAPGKRTLSESLLPVQRRASTDPAATAPATGPDGPHRSIQSLFGRPAAAGDVQAVAARGVAGSGSALPHLAQIQASFGPRHDVSHIRAHVGGPAAQAAGEIGAEAYATGDRVAFAGTPSLHTSAHEAAHVVQQRAGVQLRGGVGQAGDAYERHADEVADRVVAGQSSEDLLDQFAGRGGGAVAVQRVATAAPGTSNAHIVYGAKHNPDSLQPNARVNTAIDLVLAELLANDKGKYDAKKKSYYGYMVGVGECVDGSLVVSMSGRFRGQLSDAVKATLPGAHIAGAIVTHKGQRTFHDFRGGSRTDHVEDDEKNFGDCAGPRVLQWARIQGDKKTPIAFVEKFFSPTNSGTNEYTHGTTVAPCDAHCKTLVPWMLKGRSVVEAAGRQEVLRDQQAQAARAKTQEKKEKRREKKQLEDALREQANAKWKKVGMALYYEGRDEEVEEILRRFNERTLKEQAALDIETWVATTLQEIDEARADEWAAREQRRKPKPVKAQQPQPQHEGKGKGKAEARPLALAKPRPQPSVSVNPLLVGLIVSVLIGLVVAAVITMS